MSLLQALILGVVQGIAEFLPISSSGHLILVPWLAGWEDHGLAFDVALHIGTLTAVLVYYRDTWWRMILALLGLSPDDDKRYYRRLFGLMVLATIPGAVIGFLGNDLAEKTFRAPLLIAITLTVLGAVLLWSDRSARGKTGTIRDLGPLKALLVGIAQGCAIIPGFSRSGTTISAGLLLGLKREEAAHFSFYLSVPITLGAIVHKAPKMLEDSVALGGIFWIAILTSGIVGWLAINFLIKMLSRYSYWPFVAYRWCMAVVIVLVWLSRSAT